MSLKLSCIVGLGVMTGYGIANHYDFVTVLSSILSTVLIIETLWNKK